MEPALSRLVVPISTQSIDRRVHALHEPLPDSLIQVSIANTQRRIDRDHTHHGGAEVGLALRQLEQRTLAEARSWQRRRYRQNHAATWPQCIQPDREWMR